MIPITIDVAITSYRRPELAVAAVQSCLRQGPVLDRVIVVDDASGDDTAARLSELDDRRVLLHVRPGNGGIGAARRDALARSSADWTVMLDSDHELLPGALETLARAAARAPAQVGILGARFRWDTGAVTPEHVPEAPVDYATRIRLSAQPGGIGTDYLCCISRRVREQATWSAERSGLVDVLFQLDAALVADAQFLRDCLAYQRSDAPEGYSRGTVEHLLASRRRDAEGGVAVCKLLLERHGEALEAWGRPNLAQILREGAIFASLVGRRYLATRWAMGAVLAGGFRQVTPGLVPACFVGRGVFESAYRKRLIRGGASP